VHAGDLAVAEDIARVGAEQPDEADREPELVGLSESLEDLVEVGNLADESDRSDGEDQSDPNGEKRPPLVRPEDLAPRAQTGLSLAPGGRMALVAKGLPGCPPVAGTRVSSL
jgi:hypothetical protein